MKIDYLCLKTNKATMNRDRIPILFRNNLIRLFKEIGVWGKLCHIPNSSINELSIFLFKSGKFDRNYQSLITFNIKYEIFSILDDKDLYLINTSLKNILPYYWVQYLGKLLNENNAFMPFISGMENFSSLFDYVHYLLDEDIFFQYAIAVAFKYNSKIRANERYDKISDMFFNEILALTIK